MALVDLHSDLPFHARIHNAWIDHTNSIHRLIRSFASWWRWAAFWRNGEHESTANCFYHMFVPVRRCSSTHLFDSRMAKTTELVFPNSVPVRLAVGSKLGLVGILGQKELILWRNLDRIRVSLRIEPSSMNVSGMTLVNCRNPHTLYRRAWERPVDEANLLSGQTKLAGLVGRGQRRSVPELAQMDVLFLVYGRE